MATIRPAELPEKGALTSDAFGANDLTTPALPNAGKHRLRISLDDQGPDDISIGTDPAAGSDINEKLADVAKRIQSAVRAERPSSKAYSAFTCTADTQVDKLVLFGPAQYFPKDEPPSEMPETGAPTILQTKEFLLHRRWQDHVRCEGQLEDPEVCNAMWRELMALDEVGGLWGRNEEGIMRAPNRMNFGWRAEQKLFVKVACASHFMQFERGRHLLYRATESWLRYSRVDGAERGEFAADARGEIQASPA